MDVSDIEDKRIAHIYVQVLKTFKFKAEVWLGMMKVKELRVRNIFYFIVRAQGRTTCG